MYLQINFFESALKMKETIYKKINIIIQSEHNEKIISYGDAI